jgi:hypothetical protein
MDADSSGVLRPAVEVRMLLDDAADRIADSGTPAERRLLQAMSEVSVHRSPGAAEALVDWGATEISRLRAFGMVHAVVIEELGSVEHAWLLDRMRGEDATGDEEMVA